MRLGLSLTIILLLTSTAAATAGSSGEEFICDGISIASERDQCHEKARIFTQGETNRKHSISMQSWFSFIWPVGWWVLYYSFGLILGIYIYRDAKRRDWLLLGIRPILWLMLIFFFPAEGLIAYWAAHYSRLSQNYSEATSSQDSKQIRL